MGGTFDPPHIAHLAMAQWALDYLNLDGVRFIPTGKITYKENCTATPHDRLEMTRLSVADNPKFSVDDIEVRRQGNSYSYETLEELKRQNPKDRLFFIVGADSLNYMECWKNPQRIFDCCTVAAVNRIGYSAENMQKKKRELEILFGGEIITIPMPIMGISSTELRECVRGGKSIKYFVIPAVEKYIKDKGIYIGAET